LKSFTVLLNLFGGIENTSFHCLELLFVSLVFQISTISVPIWCNQSLGFTFSYAYIGRLFGTVV